jgi:hypothetical protein
VAEQLLWLEWIFPNHDCYDYRIITDTRILMVIIPTDTPQVPLRKEIPVTIREDQLIIMVFQEGEVSSEQLFKE